MFRAALVCGVPEAHHELPRDRINAGGLQIPAPGPSSLTGHPGIETAFRGAPIRKGASDEPFDPVENIPADEASIHRVDQNRLYRWTMSTL